MNKLAKSLAHFCPKVSFNLCCHNFSLDIVIVDSSIDAKHGDIVIAYLDGKFTIKRLQTSPVTALIPMNSNYSPIYINEGEELSIFGTVTYIIHKASNVCLS
ncbi:TPA: umuDC operon-like protein [Proteus mirabilis]|nr:umuDC operon-like protein [Proteus mirabilis]